jgi:hypothetical protein
MIGKIAPRAMKCVAAIATILGAVSLHSQVSAQIFNPATNCYDSTDGNASFCPNANVGSTGGATSHPVPAVDPCFIAQNAMRPCTPEPVGVDPMTVGTWTLQFKGGPWVWEIDRDGTYKFHSEAGDGVLPHEGKFAASNGRWMLKATNGYADAGTYRFQGRDTWIATGQLGTAPWHLDSVKAAPSKPAPPLTVIPQPAISSRR